MQLLLFISVTLLITFYLNDLTKIMTFSCFKCILIKVPILEDKHSNKETKNLSFCNKMYVIKTNVICRVNIGTQCIGVILIEFTE